LDSRLLNDNPFGFTNPPGSRENPTMAHYLLVDGHNLAFRSFYGMPDLTRSDGFPTGALHGWIRTLWKLQDDEMPDVFVVFFDLGQSARHVELHADYKATRVACPEALSDQLPYIRALTLAMGFGGVERDGVEADDLIGSWAVRLAEQGDRVTIVSADKDLGQCIRNQVVHQLLPPPTANPKLGWRRIDEEALRAKLGVNPDQVPDYLALVGDSSDNIPGLAGVGPKTAAKWLQRYRNLEEIIAHCGELKPPRFQAFVHAEQQNLRRNLLLTTIDTRVPLGELKQPSPDYEKLESLLQELEMHTALRDARKRYESDRG